MADPVLTDIWKAQVILKGKSALPEDVYVNNFFFRNDEPITDPATRIETVLSAFYTGATPASGAVGDYISTKVQDAVELRIYDLGQLPPREPLMRGFNLPLRSGDCLPHEVALVLSFYADRNLPRQRGRVYIGPLRTFAAVQTDIADVRPNPTGLPAALADRAKDMAQTAENITWVQVSQIAAMARVVTDGWIDNSFDTQRSRGAEPTTRTEWSVP